MSHHPELDLGIIRDEKDPSRSGHESGPNRLAPSGADRDILKIGLGRTEPSSGGPRLVEAGVNAASLAVDPLRQGIDVGALELLQLSVLQDQPGQLVSHGCQLFQHVGVSGRTGFCLLQNGKLILLKEHTRQLPG
jgi:hypothetical protein